MNPRYIVASQVFSSTHYAALDDSNRYISLAEGGAKTVLAAHYDKQEALQEAKHGHSEGKHTEAYASVWRRVGKEGSLYSLVRPCLPLCEYVPLSSHDLLKLAKAVEQARLEREARNIATKLENLSRI